MKHFYRIIAIVFAVALPIAAKPHSKITVGPNVRISSANSDRAHWETRIAADPDHAGSLLACSFIHSSQNNTFHTVVYRSDDSGSTWQPSLESEASDFVGDPDCIFGLDGMALFSTLPLHYELEAPHATIVYRSLDRGLHWQKPVSLPFVDREYLAIDRSSGPRRGQIYMQGNRFRKTVDGDERLLFSLFRSADRAESFKEPVELLSDGEHMPFGNGSADVLSDGTYVAIFSEWDDRKKIGEIHPIPEAGGNIKIVRSTDGGENFDKADVIAPWFECHSAMTIGIPMLAADHSNGPFKDRLYAVWGDAKTGRCDIRFSYSVDKGKTWSPSIVINDDPDPADPRHNNSQSMPVLAVNKNGAVGIAWYDRRDTRDDVGWYVRFTASLDGGETFLPSVRVSNVPEVHKRDAALPIWVYAEGGGGFPVHRRDSKFAINIATDQGESAGGDTAGMAADADGNFHPLWVDNRTGVLQLWTASISVSGAAAVNGSPDLAGLDNVSRDLMLRFTNTRYDQKNGLISFDAILVNTSDESLQAPLEMRVLSLRAATGAINIDHSDNEETGAGSVWDFSPLIDGGVLKPGQKTGVKRIEFHVTDIDPFRRDVRGFEDPYLINADCIVLGKKISAPKGTTTP
ncbi:MAG: sialidase family protein [Terriglobales bacterium]|jgi:hypothetical protein